MKFSHVGLALTLIAPFSFACPTTAAEDRIYAGEEKGYAKYADYTPKGTIFKDSKKRPFFKLSRPVARIWQRSDLQSCLAYEPVWETVSDSGVPSKVYRFSRGILFEEMGRYTVTYREYAQKWWEESGLHRVKKK